MEQEGIQRKIGEKGYTIPKAILIIFLLINLILSNYSFININENQILYTYSTLAQVIGGLYALTLTGYIFYNDKLSKVSELDETYLDIVEILKKQYFEDIKILGIGCIVTIICCIFTINAIELFDNSRIYSYILNLATFIAIFEIVFIIWFSWQMTNPDSFDRTNRMLLQENKFSTTGKEVGDLKEFLQTYNKIEEKIRNTGYRLLKQGALYDLYGNSVSKGNNKIKVMDALKILISLKILNEDIFSQYNELRIYRNSVVHSDNPEVTKEAVEEMKRIGKIISTSIDAHI